MCSCMWPCTHVCRCLWRSGDCRGQKRALDRDTRPSGAGVTGICEAPMWGLGTKLWFSERTVRGLNL